jgi:hypothetical protein
MRAVAAFAFLPFYVFWRLGIQLASLSRLGNKPWVRTDRHEPAAQAPAPTGEGSAPGSSQHG